MKVKQILPGLYLYTFPNEFELCRTFFRLQEFYESPMKKLRGNYFTYEQAISAYAYYDKKKPEFTYFSDWIGFNVPGDVIYDFNVLFQDKTVKEYKMLDKIDYSKRDGKFYIIGVVEGEENTMKHEVAHGLYYLNKEYKREMNDLLKQVPKNLQSKINKWLKKSSYCKSVYKDETHAYFSTGFNKKTLTKNQEKLHKNLIKKFKTTFEKYYKKVKK